MIRFGPGGTSGLGYDEGIAEIKRLGLSALEVEFTYGVRMKIEDAKRIGILADKNDISLSVHGPYYINLASNEPEKVEASMKRIIDSCERAHHLKATHVVFHAGFFQNMEKKKVSEIIANNIITVQDKVKENGFKTRIAPELTGKPTQFGSIPELLELRDKTGCDITIDFAHQRARNYGKIDYAEIFDSLKGLKHIHSHFSGIEWTMKGERNHVITERDVIMPLAKEIVKRNVDITIINESPDPFGDSVKTKEIIEELKK